ncbi:MAG: hypothetical protein JO306_02735 [Gemmatimonadetes bacterium]|nr:hypothetical protein [Gemmatimonadota bacterium]
MKRIAIFTALALALGTGTLAAQGAPGGPGDGPGGPPPMGPPPPPAAEIFLGHTGELKLTDAQVVRLAAIARRAAERREAQRPAAGAPRPDEARMRQIHEQMREQGRAELRDALAVLTPDQQARAFEMMSRGPGHGGPGGPGGMRGMRGAPGGPPPPAGERGDDAPPPPPQS